MTCRDTLNSTHENWSKNTAA